MLALRDFYTNVGDARMKLARNEMVTRVFLPERTAGYRGVYRKLRLRGSIDYPLAGVAVALKRSNGHVEDARVAITAVNPAPLLIRGVEKELAGKPVTEENAAAVGELAARTAKPLDHVCADSRISTRDDSRLRQASRAGSCKKVRSGKW